MEKIKYLPYVILIIGLLIAVLLLLLIKFLRAQDMKIDYSNKSIKYYIKNINGINYILIPYFFWQNGKLKAIKSLFSDRFEFEGQCYKIELLYTGQSHLQQCSDLFPQWFYRDCKSVIKRIESKSINYGNINNTYINGDNNNISIQQDQYLSIEKQIQKFIQNENHISDLDRETLQSFLYQLSKGSPEVSTAKKAIDILSKFLPFTTAIINMIKSLAF